jgi:hypothetical protein
LLAYGGRVRTASFGIDGTLSELPFLFRIFSLTARWPAEHNERKNTETATEPFTDSEHADTEAVLRHVFERTPLDPEVARRVDERAARITEHIRRTYGVIDDEAFQTLLNDDES